jgi:hypothetical protein
VVIHHFHRHRKGWVEESTEEDSLSGSLQRKLPHILEDSSQMWEALRMHLRILSVVVRIRSLIKHAGSVSESVNH